MAAHLPANRFVLRSDVTGYYASIDHEVRHGIALGCPLSPLMGAIYLHPLDEAVRTTGLCYVRFMDDVRRR